MKSQCRQDLAAQLSIQRTCVQVREVSDEMRVRVGVGCQYGLMEPSWGMLSYAYNLRFAGPVYLPKQFPTPASLVNVPEQYMRACREVCAGGEYSKDDFLL